MAAEPSIEVGSASFGNCDYADDAETAPIRLCIEAGVGNEPGEFGNCPGTLGFPGQFTKTMGSLCEDVSR